MIEESQEREQTQLEQLKNTHGWDKQGQWWTKEGKPHSSVKYPRTPGSPDMYKWL